jgi:lysophospholipase L1-like esterase
LLAALAISIICGAGPLFNNVASAELISPSVNGTPLPTTVDGSSDAFTTIRSLHASGVPIRILPLGDSITQADNVHYSYRYHLWIKLVNAEINFDFVGSMNRNLGINPEWPEYRGRFFDRDHEGHWGFKSDHILSGLPDKRDERLSEWLKAYTPDIALVHLGTNDALQLESTFSTVNELKQIIEVLRDDNPNVIVLLAKLIPVRNPLMNLRIDELNARMDAVSEAMNNMTSPVIVVDINSEIDVRRDMYDGLHPSRSGEQKMAEKWFEALKSVFGI